MSFWNIFKKKKKTDVGPLVLRMGDKKFTVPLEREKYKGSKPIVFSRGDQGFQVLGEFDKIPKFYAGQKRIKCYRLMCLETGRCFTLEKEIFDVLFVAY